MTDHNIDDESNIGASGMGEFPFQVVVRQASATMAPVSAETTSNADDDAISLEEIEAAYLLALESADLAESQALLELGHSTEPVFTDSAPVYTAPEYSEPLPTPSPVASVEPAGAEEASRPAATATSSQPAWPADSSVDTDLPVTSAEQVVEALLFVGGAPLPVKKFLDVLGGAHSSEQVETMLEALNLRYLAQQRPYEIRLVEGGYQLQLRSEFEGIRARAYGHGPKEVKLAQDALEVLALIAYQQPIDRETLNDSEKQNLPGLLRQLLRRELISVDRSDPEHGERYRTTPRFLELFGLKTLEDLPQAGTFQFK